MGFEKFWWGSWRFCCWAIRESVFLVTSRKTVVDPSARRRKLLMLLEEPVNWDVFRQSNLRFMLTKLTAVDCLTVERNVFSLKHQSRWNCRFMLSTASNYKLHELTWELLCCKNVAELLTVSVKTYGSSWISCWHDMTNCGSFSGTFQGLLVSMMILWNFDNV